MKLQIEILIKDAGDIFHSLRVTSHHEVLNGGGVVVGHWDIVE